MQYPVGFTSWDDWTEDDEEAFNRFRQVVHSCNQGAWLYPALTRSKPLRTTRSDHLASSALILTASPIMYCNAVNAAVFLSVNLGIPIMCCSAVNAAGSSSVYLSIL